MQKKSFKKEKKIEKSLKLINQIQNIRSKNNKNWMDILRLAYSLNPKATSKIMKKINIDDKKISTLLKKL